MNKILLAIVVVVVLVGALVLVNSQSKTTPSQPSQETTAPVITKQPTPKESTDEAMMEDDKMMGKEVQITVTSAGFEPKEVTVKAGMKVVWNNDGTGVANVTSAIHPTHQTYPPLNLGNFESGSSVALVFDKPGTYRYHDHLQPAHTGSVIVTQ